MRPEMKHTAKVMFRCDQDAMALLEAMGGTLGLRTRQELLSSALGLLQTCLRHLEEGYHLLFEKDGQRIMITPPRSFHGPSSTSDHRWDLFPINPLEARPPSPDMEGVMDGWAPPGPDTNIASIPTRIVAGLSKIAFETQSRPWRRSGRAGELGSLKQQMLHFLSQHPDHSARPTDLSQALSVNLPTASEAIRQMTRKGLLTKKRSSADKRSVIIALTAKGARATSAKLPWERQLGAATQQLTKEERQTLADLLERLLPAIARP